MEILNKYYKQAAALYNTVHSIEEYFASFEALINSKEAIKSELKTKTVKILKSINNQLGNFHDTRDKKEDLINKAFDSLVSHYNIGRPVSYMMMEKTHAQAQAELIASTTTETLQKFYTEREEKKAAAAKSQNNPETLGEFRDFIRVKGKESLSPEQLIKYESLIADSTLRQEESNQKYKNTVNKIQCENVNFDLHPTKHSKTGADIFTVVMVNRVNPEQFKELRIKAKQMKGYYSRYTDLRAEPPVKAGFNFDTEEEAKAFMSLKESAQDTTEAKKAQIEESKLTASERMKARAENLLEKATDSLNAERLTNTHKRAGQAATAEARASLEIVFSKKLVKIAEGLESGKIKYLAKIRNGKQLEQLQSILNRGYYLRKKSLNLTYSQEQQEQPKPLEDVNFVQYPYPTYSFKVLQDLLLPYSDKNGMIKGVKEILKEAKRGQNENGIVPFKYEGTIKLLKKMASRLDNPWNMDRILDQIKDFERIQNLGLTNEETLKTAIREFIHLSEGTQISPEDKAAAEMKALERSFIGKKIDGFFPTPEPLIESMFSMAKVFEGESILEPSAGLGHIAEAIKYKFPDNKLNVIEYNGGLSEVLSKKGFDIESTDFLTTSKKYDVIFMNPPFEKHQDIDHVKHAFSLLNDGGRLVSIMAGNKHEDSTQSKVVEFMELVSENGYLTQNEAGSFKSSFNSTGVNTVTVYLEKPMPVIPEKPKQSIKSLVSQNQFMLF